MNWRLRVSGRAAGRPRTAGAGLLAVVLTSVPAQAAGLSPVAADLPEAGLSVLRVFGALALVLALFLGGVWLFRNWQRLMVKNGRAPKLNVLEARPLGNRYALYVIGYEQQRFLIAASPAGVRLLSELPPVEAGDGAPAAAAHPVPFAQALPQVLHRR